MYPQFYFYDEYQMSDIRVYEILQFVFPFQCNAVMLAVFVLQQSFCFLVATCEYCFFSVI